MRLGAYVTLLYDPKIYNIRLYPGHEVGDSKVVEHGCIRQLITCDFLNKPSVM
jgi:hypothetical protein